MPLQADRLRDVVELLVTDFVQLLAALLELFVDLDRLLGHLLMRVLGTADQREVRSGRESLVAVGIQPDAQHQRFALP